MYCVAPGFGVRGLCFQANSAAAFPVGSPARRGAERHPGPTLSKLAARKVTHCWWKRCVTPLYLSQDCNHLHSCWCYAVSYISTVCVVSSLMLLHACNISQTDPFTLSIPSYPKNRTRKPWTRSLKQWKSGGEMYETTKDKSADFFSLFHSLE